MISIRLFTASDWPHLWPLLQVTFAAGDTYAFDPSSTESEIHRHWIEVPEATFVAHTADDVLVGTYYLKANQPGLGAHVCNCGYVVNPAFQARGIASAMCGHSQREAVMRGFTAMQFNLVVASNRRAIELWQRLGYHVVGTLPAAFKHSRLGLVDALIMFKSLSVTSEV